MKKRTARRRAIWRYNQREAKRRPHSISAPCVGRQYNREVKAYWRKARTQ